MNVIGLAIKRQTTKGLIFDYVFIIVWNADYSVYEFSRQGSGYNNLYGLRTLVEKVTVYGNYIIVEFKSGIEIQIEEQLVTLITNSSFPELRDFFSI